MSLAPGAKLGPYEILAPLGAGGMGEVYRARDAKLNRDVALKVLPESFANDPDRLARFKREAQVLASLNHSNIAGIYGFQESSGISALVLELVEGPTLADRIAQGPIPVDEALPIARQIAEALEAAHEHGIIHRDLKPANIKLTADGNVKVLDFGLAKAMGPAEAGHYVPNDMSLSPTITSPAMTMGGMILGTAAYMSPEQARGKVVDKRADIWAFGCVLYEMLTGKRAFEGDDVSEVLAGVIKSDPGWNALPAGTPPKLRALLQRCLQKDPKRRLQAIGDARIEIEEPMASPGDAVPETARPARPSRERLAWTLVAVMVLVSVAALAVGAMGYLQRAPSDTAVMRFSFAPPDGWVLEPPLARTGQSVLTLSRDGRRLAFVARSTAGRTLLWIRSLDSLTPQPLDGTEGASSPFWSPDGRFLGFFADGKLKKIEVSGGPPLTLCDAPNDRGGTWSPQGVIVFARVGSELHKVPAAGGTPVPVTVLGQGEPFHARPVFLPDGRHFLYRPQAGGGGVTHPIYLGSLDSMDRTTLLNSDSGEFFYSQGHLLFLREATLMAQPFDASRLTLTGEAFSIVETVRISGISNLFSAAESGVVAYQEGTRAVGSRLFWMDRAGKPIGMLGDRADYRHVELSPDGKRAAVTIADAARRTSDIWLYDLGRGLRTRFTFDPREDGRPMWSPDGEHIVFSSGRGGNVDVYQKASSGVGGDELLVQGDFGQNPNGWSPDGRYLLYDSLSGQGNIDVRVLPLVSEGKPFALLQTPFNETLAKFSPDGRWVAYTSNESGRNEVYVTPFPKADGKWQISTAGGSSSRWRQDGKELFYVALDNTLMAAAADGQGAAFQVGTVRPLFQYRAPVGGYNYDVSADGQRFLVNSDDEDVTSAPITVVVNWTAGPKK